MQSLRAAQTQSATSPSADSSSFPPTDEQHNILAQFRTGAPLVVQAGAGTGKTTTLELLAEDMAATGRQGIYITLNKAMAVEVGNKFVYGNVRASTIHSLAWRIAQRIPQVAPLLEKIRSDHAPMSRFHWHRVIGLSDVFTYTSFHAANLKARGENGKNTVLTSQDLMWAAIDALRLWCQSDRSDLTEEDVVRPITMPYDVYQNRYVPTILKIAHKAWTEDILNPNGKLPFTHDYYLKLVTLAKPKLTDWLALPAGSVLFFDECQDSRPCVTYLLSLQDDLQIVAVGDSSQAIYGFTGARDGLPKIRAMSGAKTASLTTSFRFGQPVADIANVVLDTLNAPIRLTGNPDKESTVHMLPADTAPSIADLDAILVRTNAQLLFAAEACMREGVPYEIVADTSVIYNLAYDYDQLEAGKKATRTDLRDFQDLKELIYYMGSDESNLPATRTTTQPLVKWIIAHSTSEAREILDRAVKETDPRPDKVVVLSTMHKAKGRQWDRVWVDMDPEQTLPFHSTMFEPEVEDNQLADAASREALMLSYVAVTRAKTDLYIAEGLYSAFLSVRRALDEYSTTTQAGTNSRFLTPAGALAPEPAADSDAPVPPKQTVAGPAGSVNPWVIEDATPQPPTPQPEPEDSAPAPAKSRETSSPARSRSGKSGLTPWPLLRESYSPDALPALAKNG